MIKDMSQELDSLKELNLDYDNTIKDLVEENSVLKQNLCLWVIKIMNWKKIIGS